MRLVSVSSPKRPDLPDLCRHQFRPNPTIEDVLAGLLISLAGPYAEHRGVCGGPMPHYSYGEFLAFAEEDAKDLEAGLAEMPTDPMNVVGSLRIAAKGERRMEERLYAEACRQTAAHVEEFWTEIEAVARKLLEAGFLGGEEAQALLDEWERDARERVGLRRLPHNP